MQTSLGKKWLLIIIFNYQTFKAYSPLLVKYPPSMQISFKLQLLIDQSLSHQKLGFNGDSQTLNCCYS